MIRDWRGAALPEVAVLFTRTAGDRYAVDDRLIGINTVESALFDWGASLVWQDEEGPLRGFVAFKKAPTRYYRTSDPDALHLSALGFDDPEIGFELFGEARRRVAERGFTKIVFGSDSRHFWPGVPTDVPVLNSFLSAQGFEFGGEAVDLERDLSGYAFTGRAPEDAEFRPLRPSDHASLERFLGATFPGRWRYDVLNKIEAEGNSDGGYGTVFGLLVRGEVRGFALLQCEGAKLPIGGAVWHESLGERWCTLGPIGVSEELRGGGYGGALLGSALQSLAERGCRRCLIDWTTLVEFYGKFGFEPTRRYRSAKLELAAPSVAELGSPL